MTLLQTISRKLTRPRPPRAESVHFHGGAHGAYVCQNAKCDSPALDLRDS